MIDGSAPHVRLDHWSRGRGLGTALEEPSPNRADDMRCAPKDVTGEMKMQGAADHRDAQRCCRSRNNEDAKTRHGLPAANVSALTPRPNQRIMLTLGAGIALQSA